MIEIAYLLIGIAAGVASLPWKKEFGNDLAFMHIAMFILMWPMLLAVLAWKAITTYLKYWK